MSIVAVHGPNTMFTTEGGGTSIPSSGGGVAQATKSGTNGLVYNFSVPNPGARPAADFDWTFTGPGSPAAQNDKFSGSVTYTGAGAGTIVLTVAAGAGPPAGGTYTINVAPTAGTPRMVEEQAGGEEPPPDEGLSPLQENTQALQENTEALHENTEEVTSDEDDVFDPGDYTIQQVEDYVNANPDQAIDILDAEEAGKNRVTLVTWLEGVIDAQ